MAREKRTSFDLLYNSVAPFNKSNRKGITQDVYDKKQQEFRSKQDEIKRKIDRLQKADEDYYITASYILILANRASDLFMKSEPKIKRQLLKLLLQNCEIDNGSLRRL